MKPTLWFIATSVLYYQGRLFYERLLGLNEDGGNWACICLRDGILGILYVCLYFVWSINILQIGILNDSLIFVIRYKTLYLIDFYSDLHEINVLFWHKDQGNQHIYVFKLA